MMVKKEPKPLKKCIVMNLRKKWKEYLSLVDFLAPGNSLENKRSLNPFLQLF